MSAITNLALTDVRCFDGTERVGLPRVAVLVGVNNAGKSTFLGCLHGMARLASLRDLNDENHFDRPPFDMGPFATIARSGATTFALEATFEGHRYERLRVVYDEGPKGEPRERELHFTLDANGASGPGFGIVRLDPSGDSGREMWRVTGPNFEFDFEQSSVSYRQFSTWLSHAVRRGNLPHDGNAILRRKRTGPSRASSTSFGETASSRRPIRRSSSPRTIRSAGGGSGRSEETRSAESWTARRSTGFGNSVGNSAFSTPLEIKRGPVGEYEVWADMSGQSRNINDVGFGVQSALPMLHAIASAPEGATLLLQRPEAHLHPRTQAAVVRAIASRGYRVLVETHSDHMADWFRIAGMSGQVNAHDLGVLYFQRSDDGSSSVPHDIRVDEQANLVDAPPGFREFFLDETERLLGFRR